MKILVIGSEGFIGSHLVKHFSSKHSVAGCDVKEKGVTEIYQSVSRIGCDYNEVIAAVRPEICIYAAGNGSVPFSIAEPYTDFLLNTVNVQNALEAIRRNNPECKFIHLSSAAVYGNQEKLPIQENAIIQPVSPYGWHKYLAELICLENHKLYKIPTINLRLFSVYGEGLRKQIFWDLSEKAAKGSISLFGSGDESRDFIYISDVVKAIELIIGQAIFDGGAINVGSGTETTIREAAESFCKIYSTDKPAFTGRKKSGDPDNWKADISRLNLMGFKPETSLYDGLTQYIRWVKGNA